VIHELAIWNCQVKWLLVVATITATAFLVACSTVEAPSAADTPFPFTFQVLTPTPPSQAPECLVVLCCFHCPVFQVSRVIDGDTFVVGRRTDGKELRIRLYGVDTPERGEPCFQEATERFRELAGNSVRIKYGPRETDRYGRLLAYVYTESAESIAEKLIQEGVGEAWTRDGQHRDLLVELEERARQDGSGCLW